MEMEVKTLPGLGTPQGRLASFRAVSLGQHLLALDDLWTAELGRVTESATISDDDLEMLVELVEGMRGGLKRLPDVAYELRNMLDELGPERFDRALEAIGEASERPFFPRDMLADELPDYEPQSAAIAACDYVREKASGEAALLGEKLEVLRRGEMTPGDFLLPFNCAMHLFVLGASVSGTILLGGAVGPVALSLVGPAYSAVQSWRRDGCRVEIPAITFGRRA
jgi:hypothetical protein